jgi:hypothetical protein
MIHGQQNVKYSLFFILRAYFKAVLEIMHVCDCIGDEFSDYVIFWPMTDYREKTMPLERKINGDYVFCVDLRRHSECLPTRY